MATRSPKASARKRPTPPQQLIGLDGFPEVDFLPAPDVLAWLREQILEADGPLHNPDHRHLLDADLAVLWAASGFVTKGRTVVGQAEQVAFRCNAWQRGRQEQQMCQWFGRVPEYLITLDAGYCMQCDDTAFCALVEHEMYHLAHQHDPFGAPLFTKDGQPKLMIRGHDVEEFVGVVRRYGAGSRDGAVAQLARAAMSQPEVSRVNIAGACGTCLLRVA